MTAVSGSGWHVQAHSFPALTYSVKFLLPDVLLKISIRIVLQGLIKSQMYWLNVLNDNLSGVSRLVSQ